MILLRFENCGTLKKKNGRHGLIDSIDSIRFSEKHEECHGSADVIASTASELFNGQNN